MTTKNDVREGLRQLGGADVPEPRAAFVELLEERLTAIASTPPSVENAARAQVFRPRRPRLALAPMLAATILVVALVVGVALDRNTASAALELHAPVNVEVILPDGRVVRGVDGMRLPDGARLVIGSSGSVRVGERLLREGDVAVVVDGRLEVTEPSPPVTTDPRDAATTTVPVRAGPPTNAAEAPQPTEAPDVPAPRPAPTEPPATTAAPEPTRPPATTTTTRAEPSSLDLQLTVLEGRNVKLTWRSIPGATRYAIVRTTSETDAAPAEPVYPAQPPSYLVAENATSPWSQPVPAGVRAVRYRVIALDSTGRVIATSRFVGTEFPA
jgi:hypothetical protein